MKRLEIYQVAQNYYTNSGSGILNNFPDNSTPRLDLFVRESLQNSADAGLPNAQFVKVFYQYDYFDAKRLASFLPDVLEQRFVRDCEKRNDSLFHFLSIGDKNTTGLTGTPYLDRQSRDGNLYKLVYDVMNGKSDSYSGGSHGLGKTLYYRLGNGLVFYYTRIIEEGQYKEKLIGAILEDEKGRHPLLPSDSLGLAFLGEKCERNGQQLCVPIEDEERIAKFLDIFKISRYTDEETGTVVIIPFLKDREILARSIDPDNFEYSLSTTIQRWYFARLNNNQYDGNYLKVFINREPIQLNAFFGTLQKLYNGELPDAFDYPVIIDKSNLLVGHFKYKVFTYSELGVNVPPNNLPSPQEMTGIEEDDNKHAICCYVRKPGMIVNFDFANEVCGKNLSLKDSECLIGIFVLKDDAYYKGELLGKYIRKTELANHKSWNDCDIQEMPVFSSLQPFKKIKKVIKNELYSKFSNEEKEKKQKSTNLQRNLAKWFLPPSGFGKAPEIGGQPNGGRSASKNRNVVITFLGFKGTKGHPLYNFMVTLEPKKSAIVSEFVKTSAKTYSLSDWERLGFSCPSKIEQMKIAKFCVGRIQALPEHKMDPSLFNETNEYVHPDSKGNSLFGISAKWSISNEVESICFKNKTEQIVVINLEVTLNPKEVTYQICFKSEK